MDYGRIMSISLGSFVSKTINYAEGYLVKHLGVVIKTTTTEIRFGVENWTIEDECFGFFSLAEEDYEDYIGAKVESVARVPANRWFSSIEKALEEDLCHEFECEEAMFFNVRTSRGTIPFACYGNGYKERDARAEVGETLVAECAL